MPEKTSKEAEKDSMVFGVSPLNKDTSGLATSNSETSPKTMETTIKEDTNKRKLWRNSDGRLVGFTDTLGREWVLSQEVEVLLNRREQETTSLLSKKVMEIVDKIEKDITHRISEIKASLDEHKKEKHTLVELENGLNDDCMNCAVANAGLDILENTRAEFRFHFGELSSLFKQGDGEQG